MVKESDTTLSESWGYALQGLFFKSAYDDHTQWGYLMTHPVRSFPVPNDQDTTVQALELSLNGK
jgi:hypothetical protein